MVVGIGLWFNRVCFELIIEYFRYNLTRLVCTNIMFAYEYAGNITFVARFEWLAKVITFDMFSMMVDEALEQMRTMLDSNEAVQKLIANEAGEGSE